MDDEKTVDAINEASVKYMLDYLSKPSPFERLIPRVLDANGDWYVAPLESKTIRWKRLSEI